MYAPAAGAPQGFWNGNNWYTNETGVGMSAIVYPPINNQPATYTHSPIQVDASQPVIPMDVWLSTFNGSSQYSTLLGKVLSNGPLSILGVEVRANLDQFVVGAVTYDRI
jgi:hypothetical protein